MTASSGDRGREVQRAAASLDEVLSLPDSALEAAVRLLKPVERRRLSEALRGVESAVQRESDAVAEWSELMGQEPQAAQHAGMQAHDGYVAHSHEVRADHLGVERIEPDGPPGVLGLGIPYAWTDPVTGVRQCPLCEADFAEDYGLDAERVSDNYGDHYRQWHASLPHDGQAQEGSS